MKPIFATIAACSARREPRLNTLARRFCRRARDHGVMITEPITFRASYVVIRPRGRAIRIDEDGACLQLSAYSDSGRQANHARSHAHMLDLAGRFRRRGRYIIARACLDNCARDRPECPPLPA